MPAKRRHASTVSGADLAALIGRRREALLAHVDAARAGDVKGVHQARVASRRLRESIPILAVGLDDVRAKRLGRGLRDLTRTLGPVRELDVALGMVAELPLDGDDASRLRATWSRWMQARRRPPARTLRKALARAARLPLEKHLIAFEAARATSDDQTWRTALAERLTERAGTLLDRIGQTGALFDAEPLHEVRIAAKKLRYALELGDEAGVARLEARLRTLKAAQDALGRLHDIDVLLGLLRGWLETDSGGRLRRAADHITEVLEDEARTLHARYLRARPSLVRVADVTRERIAPRVLSGAAPIRPHVLANG